MKTALITGITGQDGSYLAQLLSSNGYMVYGLVRNQVPGNKPYLAQTKNLNFCLGDLANYTSLINALEKTKPDEIYNLASQSHPGLSWHQSLETGDITGLGAHRLFEAARQVTPEAKIFQASSSEIFGNAESAPQNEQTPLSPINPYAIAKVYAQQMARLYRDIHGLFISCGILFNHESPRRDMGFITQKVSLGAACAKLGISNSPQLDTEGKPFVYSGKITLGNLNGTRDWGYAPDYVEAMHLMLQANTPDDFVIGTGIAHTVAELCKTAYEHVGLDWQKYITTDPALIRPRETALSVADTKKATNMLGWKYKTPFKEMVTIMVDAHLNALG